MASRRAAHMAVVLTAAGALTIACGQKGPPLAPLHLVPAAANEVSVRRVADRARLRFVLPSRNENGPGPLELDRVQIYAMTIPANSVEPSMQELMAKERLVGEIAVRPVLEEGEVAPPDEKRPEPGSPVTFDEELTTQKLTPVEVQTPPPPRRPTCGGDSSCGDSRRNGARRCRDAGDHNTSTGDHNAGAGAHNSGTRSNGTGRRAAGGDSAGSHRSGRSGRGNGCRAWSGSSGRGSDCCPSPGRRGRAAQAGDGAVHAPFVCRAWRDPQGADGSGLEPPVAAARAAGAAAGDCSRAVQRNGGDRRVGSGRNRHRLQRLPRRGSAPAGESGAAEVGLVRADGRRVRSGAVLPGAQRVEPGSGGYRRGGIAAPVRDAARPVRAGSARAGWRPCRPPARSA